MKKLFANPYLLLMLTVLFWSGNMVVGRGARGPPLTFSFWRWFIAFLFILPLALPHLNAQWPLLKKGWRPLLVLGLLGVGGYNTFAYLALQYTTATNATLLNSFIPVATIAISWAFLGKHLRRAEASAYWSPMRCADHCLARRSGSPRPSESQCRRRLDAGCRA
jgi:drug/metabolite transporter (DMT)-like permease